MKAVLFDLDGTLVNTLPDLAAATNAALRENGFAVHPTDAYRRFVGDGARVLAQRALGNAATEENVERVLASFLRIYDGMCLDAACPYPGIPEVVERLRAAGFALSVVTNKPQPQAEKITRRFFGDAFCGVYGGGERYPRKPDPASPLLALRELGVLPQNAWFVGDSDVDVATAAAAGLWFVGAAWGFRGEGELRAAGADKVARTAEELAELIL